MQAPGDTARQAQVGLAEQDVDPARHDDGGVDQDAVARRLDHESFLPEGTAERIIPASECPVIACLCPAHPPLGHANRARR